MHVPDVGYEALTPLRERERERSDGTSRKWGRQPRGFWLESHWTWNLLELNQNETIGMNEVELIRVVSEISKLVFHTRRWDIVCQLTSLICKWNCKSSYFLFFFFFRKPRDNSVSTKQHWRKQEKKLKRLMQDCKGLNLRQLWFRMWFH